MEVVAWCIWMHYCCQWFQVMAACVRMTKVNWAVERQWCWKRVQNLQKCGLIKRSCMCVCVCVGYDPVSGTALERNASIHNTIWKLLPLEWVEWKAKLWHADRAAVFLWLQTVLVAAEGLIKKVGSRTEARGLLTKLCCHSAGFKLSREG